VQELNVHSYIIYTRIHIYVIGLGIAVFRAPTIQLHDPRAKRMYKAFGSGMYLGGGEGGIPSTRVENSSGI